MEEKGGREDGREGWKRRMEEKNGREGWKRRVEEKGGREWWKRMVEEKGGSEEWKRRMEEKGEEEDTMGKGGMTAMRGSIQRKKAGQQGRDAR